MAKPNSFVAPALSAFLAVSKNNREDQKIAASNSKRNQDSFLKAQLNQRASEAQQLSSNLKLQEMEIFMEEAAYEKNVMRPLKHEAYLFARDQKRRAIQDAADDQNTDKGILGDFQSDVEQLRGVMSGELDVSRPVTEVKDQTTYINKVTGEPVIAMDQGDGLMLYGKGNVKVKTDNKNLRKVKTYGPSDPHNLTLAEVLEETRLNGSDEIVRAQNGIAMLNEMQQKAISSPRHAKLTANQVKLLTENVGRNPHVSFLQQEGNTLPPDLRERRQRQGEASVQGALRAMLGDKKATEWAAENPMSVRDMSGLTQEQQFAQAQVIGKRLDEEAKIARDGVKPRTLTTDERSVQKLQREATVNKTLIARKFAELQSEKRRDTDSSDPRSTKIQRDNIESLAEELIKLNAEAVKLEAQLGSYSEPVTTDGPLGTTIELPSRNSPTQSVSDFFSN